MMALSKGAERIRMWKEPGEMSQEELSHSGTGVREGFCKETNDVACILTLLVVTMQAFFFLPIIK